MRNTGIESFSIAASSQSATAASAYAENRGRCTLYSRVSMRPGDSRSMSTSARDSESSS